MSGKINREIDYPALREQWEQIVIDPEWRQSGECNGTNPELFFPEQGDHDTLARAQEACGRCVVQAACLVESLAKRSLKGVQGGESEKGRNDIRKKLTAQEINFSLKEPALAS